ncbi:MAG: hypothetical protein EOO88_24945 [Pedobacter sp.]|nr:MAG: hypothetical protein EOO88_24945 [Pedobacter sp.]
MAKALALSPEALSAHQITPKAATPPRAAVAQKVTAEETSKLVQESTHPLQIRIPREEARAIKIAAAERDMTMSEFMLACFHAYMNINKSS